MRIAAPKHSTTTTNHIDENLLPTPSCPKHHAFPFLNDNRFILSREQRNDFSFNDHDVYDSSSLLSLSLTVPHHQGQATLSLSTGSSASNLPAKRTGRYQHLATPHHCLSLSIKRLTRPDSFRHLRFSLHLYPYHQYQTPHDQRPGAASSDKRRGPFWFFLISLLALTVTLLITFFPPVFFSRFPFERVELGWGGYVCMPGWVVEPEKASTGSDWTEQKKNPAPKKKKGNGKKGLRNCGKTGANDERRKQSPPACLFVLLTVTMFCSFV